MIMPGATAWGFALRWALLLVSAYAVLILAAAYSSSLTEGKEPALLAWIGASGLLFALLVWTAHRATILAGARVKKVVVVGAIAVSVVVLAFFGFVAMVNIWESLGLGH
jgi:hypothetical protein